MKQQAPALQRLQARKKMRVKMNGRSGHGPCLPRTSVLADMFAEQTKAETKSTATVKKAKNTEQKLRAPKSTGIEKKRMTTAKKKISVRVASVPKSVSSSTPQ